MVSVSSVFSDNLLRMNPPDYQLWDFAGVDGLQVAISLFSPAVSYLAPFQSFSAALGHQPCSVLRLCENNFRVAAPEDVDFARAITQLELKIWVKPSPTANLVMPAALGLSRLAQIATTKPLFTLNPFPLNRAVPVRIDGAAILAWHHLWQGQPTLLIQAAATDFQAIQRMFNEVC